MRLCEIGKIAGLFWLLMFGCNRENNQDLCESYPDQESSPYVLPYPVGSKYLLIQGNCSDPNAPINSQVGHDRYAYDFMMDKGSLITAARSGVVVFAREEFTDQHKQINQGNVVVIQHDDGTHAAYGHLTQHGVIPEVGALVKQGDTIAISGNSGLSSIPHLHFHISPCLDQAICETIPTTFKNATVHPNGLKADESYQALPY